MRKYEPIWNAIKKHSFAKVSAAKKHHKTIIKAVKKEKYYDQIWKYECLEKDIVYKLKIVSESEHITFKLVTYAPPSLDLL